MDERSRTGAAHGPNAAVYLLALAVPILISMVPLAIAPGALLIAGEFGTQTAQTVLTLPAFIMILAASVCGYLTERVGRRVVIVGALLLYAVAAVPGFLARDLAVLLASRVVTGFSAGLLLSTTYAVIGEYYEGNARERLLGFMTLSSAVSSVSLLVLIGPVIEHFGWRASFLLYAVALPLVPLAFAGLHKGLSVGAEVAPLGWGPVLRAWPVFLLLAVYAVGMFMMVIQGPFLLATKGIADPSSVGRLTAVSSGVAGLASAVYGWMRRYLGFRQMLVLISLSLGIGLPLATSSHDTAIFVMAAVTAGFAMGVLEPTIASELMKRTPEPLHDRAMGVNVAFLFFGQFLNPMAVRAIGEVNLAFIVGGAFYLLCAGLFVTAILVSRRQAP